MNIRRKVRNPYTPKIIYSFESFDAFCDFCTFINQTENKDEFLNVSKSASLYEYKSNFYLTFSGINLYSKVLDFLYPVITEFAHIIDVPELFEKQITEYGKIVIKDDALLVGTTYFTEKPRKNNIFYV